VYHDYYLGLQEEESNGTYQAQLNLHGFLQVEGEHHDVHSISSPVVTIITIHIMLTLLTVIINWYMLHFYLEIGKVIIKSTWKFPKVGHITIQWEWYDIY
jgi:hypothetical protein